MPVTKSLCNFWKKKKLKVDSNNFRTCCFSASARPVVPRSSVVINGEGPGEIPLPKPEKFLFVGKKIENFSKIAPLSLNQEK